MDRRVDHKKRERFEQLRREIADRIRTVCASFCQSELESLTAKMARIHQRYESKTAVPGA
jgi:hypothetical protein